MTSPGPLEYSVVVPTLGERETLSRCLDCLAAQTRPPAEVVVVAAEGAPVDTREGVRIAHSPASTSGQRNAGARLVSTPVVLFVDDDVLLEPDFGDVMMGTWERLGAESLAGVMGTIINDPWELRFSRRLVRAALGQSHVTFRRGRHTHLMASGNVAFVPDPGDDEDVGFAGTACVSYRRDLFLDEPFDESLPGYVLGEDLDLSARLARRGRLIQTPRARARHLEVGVKGDDETSGAHLRGRLYALYRGRHRAPGIRGRLAWEWANLGELGILAAKSMRRGDLRLAAAFWAGLREARAQLRSEGTRGESP
ncbi:MAG: glycosyltransferase family 2 protein [Solirubrobacterales bacterium]